MSGVPTGNELGRRIETYADDGWSDICGPFPAATSSSDVACGTCLAAALCEVGYVCGGCPLLLREARVIEEGAAESAACGHPP